MRRERDGAAAPRVARHGLLDLGYVLVPAEPIGAQVLVDLAEAVVLVRLAARPRDAAHGGDGDAVRRDEPGPHQRREGHGGGRRVAAGVRDELRAGELGSGELGEAVARLGEELLRRVIETVPARVHGGVLEAEGAREVHHADAARKEPRREVDRDLRRRGEEGDLGVQLRGLRERAVAESGGRPRERETVTRSFAGPAIGEEGGRPEPGVSRQIPGELEPGVAGGAHDRGRKDMHACA